MKIRRFSQLYLVVLLPIWLWPLPARAPIEHPFPMSPGTSWIYRGAVRWTHDMNQVSETSVTWRTEIRRVMQHGEFSAAVISGFPSDLDWSDGHPQVTDSLLIEARGKFYLISGERLQDAVRRFEQPADNLDGLFSDDDLILQWPLERGQKFCDSDGLARVDNRYCWFVSSVAPASMPAASGITVAKRPEYMLEFRTNPDDREFSFVPELGITRYSYHHHGTVADTELQLKEFHIAADNSK